MTVPFGPALENALKTTRQGGRLYVCTGAVVNPRFFCCLSGTSVGVAKDPVAVLHVDPTRGCYDPGGGAGTTFTAGVALSWSPSSTINAWSVDWGDGTINAVIPPAVDTHQYTLPGTYTVTLTVTDLLGATGVDTVEVEVLDCIVIPDIEAICGEGASGVWHTTSGGRNWDLIGLDGITIYDLDVSPFTFGLPCQRIWAATADGLYQSANTGVAWQPVILPIPDGEIAVPTIVAVKCSPLYEREVYVLGYRPGSNTIWLYRTKDNGEIWSYVALGGGNWSCGTRLQYLGNPGDFDRGSKLAPRAAETQLAVGEDGQFVLHRSGNDWLDRGGWFGGAPICGIGRTSSPYCVDATTAQTGIGWNLGDCSSWAQYFSPNVYNDLEEDTIAWAARADQKRIDKIDVGNNLIPETVNLEAPAWGLAPTGYPMHVMDAQQIAAPNHDLVLVGTNLPEILVYDDDANSLVREDAGHTVAGGFGRLYLPAFVTRHCAAIAGATRLRVRTQDVFPQWVNDGAICPTSIHCVAMGSGPNTIVGTNVGIYIRDQVWPAGTYTKICNLPNVRRLWGQANLTSGTAHGYAYTEQGIYTWSSILLQSLIPPTVGRHHIMSISADGDSIYLALLDATNTPIVLRVAYDFSEAVECLNTAGTWGGVKADYYYTGRVWAFGDFGAAGNKIQRSEDYGDTWVNVTPGGLGAGEVVRPVLPDCYDPDDVIAILNVDLRAYRTRDGGAAIPTWADRGAIPFACHCAERDWIESQNAYIGRAVAGANHLQYTYDAGRDWLERSGGLTANAPIVAIVIVG